MRVWIPSFEGMTGKNDREGDMEFYLRREGVISAMSPAPIITMISPFLRGSFFISLGIFFREPIYLARGKFWIPAFAGMTEVVVVMTEVAGMTEVVVVMTEEGVERDLLISLAKDSELILCDSSSLPFGL